MSAKSRKVAPVMVARSDGSRVSVDAWSITGSACLVVTRALVGKGYRVTHPASGMCMPGESFPTIDRAAGAWRRMLLHVPKANELAFHAASGTLTDAERAEMAHAWRQVLGVPPVPPPPSSMSDVLRDMLPEGWSGDLDVLECPCGYTIEHDGRCPSGCVSPLLVAGVI